MTASKPPDSPSGATDVAQNNQPLRNLTTAADASLTLTAQDHAIQQLAGVFEDHRRGEKQAIAFLTALSVSAPVLTGLGFIHGASLVDGLAAGAVCGLATLFSAWVTKRKAPPLQAMINGDCTVDVSRWRRFLRRNSRMTRLAVRTSWLVSALMMGTALWRSDPAIMVVALFAAISGAAISRTVGSKLDAYLKQLGPASPSGK